MAWYFHRATTMALPANALVIPIASVLLPSAVLAVALSYLSHWLALVPAVIAAYALDALTGTIRIIGHLRISDVRVPTPTLAVSFCGTSLWPGSRCSPDGDSGGNRNRWTSGFRRLDCAPAAEAAMRVLAFRDDGHRRWPGRFAAADHSRGQNPAARCRRHDRESCAPTSMLARKLFRPISGRAASAGWMRSPFPMPTAITWAECAASSRIFSRANSGTAWSLPAGDFSRWSRRPRSYHVG